MGKKTKNEALRKIDQKTQTQGGGLPFLQEEMIAPPAVRVLPAPDDLRYVTQGIQRSTQAPLAFVSMEWDEAPNISPDFYNVEWSLSSTFTDVQRKRANQLSATIEGLATQTTYYFRVQAVSGGAFSDFSNTLTVTTLADLTPPPETTGKTAAFQNSDLVITWVKPISEAFKDVEIKIYNAAHTVLLAGPFYSASDHFVWTAEQNNFYTNGVPATSVKVDVKSRSWSNILSTGETLAATAPIPATPTGYVSNWIGDTGNASADFTTSWLASANADSYDITVDGISYKTKDLRFVYRYDKNVQDHAPTIPSGDPSFIWTLAARDKLGQVSTAVNVTVTNAAPPSGVMSLTTYPGFSSLAAKVSLLSNAIVQDFDHFEWTLSSGSTTVATLNSTDTYVTIPVAAAGVYSLSVKMVDKFNQKNTAVTVSNISMDALTIDQLRAETTYTDSLNTSAAVLNRLKDGVVYDGSGAYQFYPASSSWNWLMAQRPLLDRYKTITWAAFWPAGFNLVFQVWDGSGSNYYAAPVTTSATGVMTLTKYTTLAAAQASPINQVAGGSGTLRYELPAIAEARAVVAWFQNASGSLGVYEFYPRRLVQSDDIEAESIRAINIASAAVTADKISVLNLQAVSANMGALHMDGVIDIIATGGIYQGTGTFASPTTGLKLFNVSGIGKLSGYSGGVEQITLDTDGKLKAGGGDTVFDRNGMSLYVTNAWAHTVNGIDSARSVTFKSSYTGLNVGLLSAADFASYHYVDLMANQGSGKYGVLNMEANSTDGNTGCFVQLTGGADYTQSNVAIWSKQIDIVGYSTVRAEVNLGSSMGDANADIYMYGTTRQVGPLLAVNSGSYLQVGTTAANYIPNTSNWSTGGSNILVQGADWSSIGFHDAGARVDYILVGGGIMHLGYNAGWGNATIQVLGNAGFGDAPPANNKVRIKGIDSSSDNGALIVQNSAGTTLMQNRNDNVNQVGTAWVVISDEGTKNDITLLPAGLAEIKKLKPKKYRTKSGDHPTFGLVAQDVQAIFPDMVIELEDGVLGLRYNDLIPVLVNAVIELQDQIDKLTPKGNNPK